MKMRIYYLGGGVGLFLFLLGVVGHKRVKERGDSGLKKESEKTPTPTTQIRNSGY